MEEYRHSHRLLSADVMDVFSHLKQMRRSSKHISKRLIYLVTIKQAHKQTIDISNLLHSEIIMFHNLHINSHPAY